MMQLKRLGSLALAVPLMFGTAAAHADWTDTFDGGLDQTWTFADNGGNILLGPAGMMGGSNSAFSYATSGDMLTLADIDADAGNGPGFIAGLVMGQSFGDVRVSGTINPAGDLESSAGLLARTNLATASGYNLMFHPTGELGLYVITGGNSALLSSSTNAQLSGSSSYFLELDVVGVGEVSLVGRIWDSAAKGTLLDTVEAVHLASSYDMGDSGILLTVNDGPLMGTWDGVTSSSTIPEPASMLLLGAGGLLLAARRRAAH